jgi:hypothetical protein
MMQSVKHGNLAININGEQGPFFPSTRGVRQGDPISPLLFDYVVDGLAAMVDVARQAGHISGLVPDLVEGGVNMLQYADDTVILLGKSDLNVLHMKFLLYGFESMSGMKINYHKSEVFVLGCDVEE